MAILLVNLTAFSQIVTKSTTTDSIIPLPKNVAKEVAKDIIRKDSLETELKSVKLDVSLLKNNLVAKDSIIISKDAIIALWVEKEKNYLSIINLKDLQKANVETLNKTLAADLRKAKRKSTTKTIVGTAIVGGLLYLVIAK
jgi:hypothetical protein